MEVLYWIFLVVWVVFLLAWVSRKLFSWPWSENKPTAEGCCKCSWLLVYVLVALPLITWLTWGDSSHLFLFSCLATMVVSVLGLLTYKLLCSCGGCKGVCILTYVILTICLWIGAGYVFLGLPTTDKVKEPHESRSMNEECFLLDFFDYHDLWHMLSSFALLISAYLLLYATRKIEIRLWNERTHSGSALEMP